VASHAITLHIQVSAADYTDATRLLRAGNLNANPLTVALLGMSAYALVSYTGDRITLRQVISRRRYSGPVPAVLADYLAGFRRGVRVFEDREFELVLENEGD
jgi:hypothetical protein